MARIKTFANSGAGAKLLPADLNLIQDAYEPAFTTWKTVGFFEGATVVGQSSPTQPINAYHVALQSDFLGKGVSPTFNWERGAETRGFGMLHVDTTQYPVGAGRTLQFRLRAWVFSNAVNPNTTYRFTLHAYDGPGSGTTYLFSSGAAVAGTTTDVNVTAANTRVGPVTTPSPFSLTSDGYVIACTATGVPPAGAFVRLGAQLQWRAA